MATQTERTRQKRERMNEESVQALLREYSGTRELDLRNKIVEQYGNLVESIARRFSGSGEPVEDMVQEGCLGLISAVDLFDLDRGVKFSTFATHFIIGQIKHYLRDKGKIIKEPAWLQELNQRMNRVIESLSQQFGRPPTDREIAQVMNLSEEQVTDLLTTREVFKVSSLDGGDKDDNNFQPHPERTKSEKCVTFQLPIEDKIVLETAMDRLKSIEQRVLYEFFYLDLNQTEIARKLGISCNYVSHILRNSTKKLKRILVTEELRDAQMQLHLLNRRLQDQTQALEQLTVVDSGTGLYNRRYFVERLDEELTRACRHNYPLSVLVVHVTPPRAKAGEMPFVRIDELILKASAVIRANVRKVDVVARLSELTFALALPHTGPHAPVVAERIAEHVGGLDFGQTASGPVCPSVHTAFRCYPHDGRSVADLLPPAIEELGLDYEEKPQEAPKRVERRKAA